MSFILLHHMRISMYHQAPKQRLDYFPLRTEYHVWHNEGRGSLPSGHSRKILKKTDYGFEKIGFMDKQNGRLEAQYFTKINFDGHFILY